MIPLLHQCQRAAGCMPWRGLQRYVGCKTFRRCYGSFKQLTTRSHKLSWSKLYCIRTLHKSKCYTTVTDSELNRSVGKEDSAYVPEWREPFCLKDPELDMDYLLHPDNLREIQDNIVNRKGVGNIEQLVSKWLIISSATKFQFT